jgi:S-adenosylmethionine synthetase
MIIQRKYTPLSFEVVERKGTGHPDTLADGISESISRDLSRAYLEEYGEILHHNVDKVLMIAGKSSPEFGGGKIIKPPYVVVGGRATALSRRSLNDTIKESVTSFLKRIVPDLKEFLIEPRTGEGAPELRSLVGRGANDTSIGVGFAPMDDVERLVLDIEPRIRAIKGVGADTKIMAVRIGEELRIIVAAAMVSRDLYSREDYDEAKSRVKEAVEKLAPAEVVVNAADFEDNIFLTVTGTSLEMGDDGATGRGNRGSGLITPMRPMTMEAIAGKNPVIHVGKIYNVLARKSAEDISALEGIKEAYVTLVSKIGAPLNEPLLKGVEVFGDEDLKLDAQLQSRIDSIVDYWLEEANGLSEDFVEGKLTIY